MTSGGPPRPRTSVRAKVLVWVLATAATGMAIAGSTSFVLHSARLDRQIDESLLQELKEFQTLAEVGIDPQTGEPFRGVEQLLDVVLQRNVPDAYETHLTLVRGAVRGYSGGERPVDLHLEPDALAAITGVPGDTGVALREVQTRAGTVRLVIVQVGMAGQPTTGTYVVGHAVGSHRAELVDLMNIYALVAAGALLLVAAVGWVVAGRLLGPLRGLREAAERISEHDLVERIPVRGDDDVSALTVSFNAMLDRLQSAFETQRQFLDDAGHELRTPLTILTGHLELLDPHEPDVVEETRALLIDEAARMSRLVEDLILLAKARRPDFVRWETVDLAALTDDVLEKARPLGERRWRLDALPDARMRGDAQRLTQAMLQLCHNAVKFSAAGSTVAVGSDVVREAGGARTARLWVRDTGVGLHPEDFDRVFDRFARAHPGRGVEGSGLGLAIVNAIAEAHRGRVDVRSTPGKGSTFTLVLPLDEGGDQPPDDLSGRPE